MLPDLEASNAGTAHDRDIYFETLVAPDVAPFACATRIGSRSVDAMEIPVELALETAEELEGDHEEDDTDTGASEGAFAGDLPGSGDETAVDGIPIPEHLSNKHVSITEGHDAAADSCSVVSQVRVR